VGLARPPTWFPDDQSDLSAIEREATFPVILKARTQVHRLAQTKGIVVDHPSLLLAGYRKFLAGHRYSPGLEPHFHGATQPMVQRYFPAGGQRIYSVTGFIDREGNVLAARAAVKVLQRTKPVGLGVCFEAAELDPGLAEAVARLCREVGHFGVFEVEFVREGGESMVIDFNPRFYGQMGFDAARGLPLAVFVYHAARGDTTALRALAAQAASSTGGATIYTHHFIFELLLLVERLGGSMSSADHARWRDWYARNQGSAADASADSGDRLPGLIHTASEAWSGLRALPRVLFPSSRAGAG
jgi:D-aspartate ligase